MNMKILKILLAISICNLAVSSSMNAQCSNEIHYPDHLFLAPEEGDTTVISELQFAGDYSEMAAFQKDIGYTIFANEGTDYITVRSLISDMVLEHGPAPLTFIPVTDTVVRIHFNLVEPPCGTDTNPRLTGVTNIGVPVDDDTKVGINTLEPVATLDVNGKIRIADDETTPVAGMLRYNEETQDFEGFDGSKWRSLTTASGSWGEVVSPEVKQTKKLQIPNGAAFDLFGEKIAHHGQRLAVTSSGSDVDGVYNQGRVYVFEDSGNGYMLTDSLDDPNGREFGYFANRSIASRGDYIIVGSVQNIKLPDGSVNASATIFHKSGDVWLVDQVITDSADGTKTIGGATVDIFPPYALVNGSLNGEGHAFIYKKSNGVWNEIQAIANPSDVGDSSFGAHAIIEDTRLFISDPNLLYGDDKKGLIYYFENNGNDIYELIDSIFSNEVHKSANSFASEFSVDGDYLAVSDAREEYDDPDRRGAVDIHHFENSEWTRETTIRMPPGSNNDLFGYHVDIFGEEIVVSSIGIIGSPVHDHKAFVYKKVDNEWTNTAILKPSDAQPISYFGVNVAIGNNVIFVSDFQDDINGNTNQGSVYMYCR